MEIQPPPQQHRLTIQFNVISAVIDYFVLSAVWKGKQWGYVTVLCLILFGFVYTLGRTSATKIDLPRGTAFVVFVGRLIGIGKAIFYGARLAGVVVPKLD